MTQTEYMLLQHQLAGKLRCNPYIGRSVYSTRRAEGFEEGIKTAKSILHAFYQEFGEDQRATDEYETD